MYNRKIVFILGAGASCSYGYPTGEGLIQDIIANIKNDEIFVFFNKEEIEKFKKSGDNKVSLSEIKGSYVKNLNLDSFKSLDFPSDDYI